MPKKKTILDKIVYKDYSNQLEKVIETKDFDEGVKNLLLEIFYKVDVSYKDYKKVKRNEETKQEYIERLLKIIQNKCDKIKIIKPNTEEAKKINEKKFLTNQQNKEIICYPIEIKLLYAICEIGKQEKIIKGKYSLVNKTISNIINIGNSIDTIEPIRDFSGWSWQVFKNEIENITYNLIYQNLRILVGDKFLNTWVENNEYIIDYYDLFQDELEENFGTKLKKEIIQKLENLSIFLEIETDKKYKKALEGLRQYNEAEISKMQENEEKIEKARIEKIQKLLEVLDIENKIEEKNKILEEFQKIFLQCFLVFINNAKTKEEIVNLMYIFRYYNLIPFNKEIDIYQNKKLKIYLKKVSEELIKKAIEHKVINNISEKLEENTKILQYIFQTKIISIEDIYIKIIKEKEKYYVEFSENSESSFEEKFEISKKENLSISFNKRVKIFN